MKRDEIAEYVENWIDAWNGRDVEAVLVHFSDDVRFTSPAAARVVGNPTVAGKAALRSYGSQHSSVSRNFGSPSTARYGTTSATSSPSSTTGTSTDSETRPANS